MRTSLITLTCAVSFAFVGAGQLSVAQSVPLKLQITDALKAEIQSVSLLAKSLNETGRTNTYILTAAQSDYQRILAVLYENGYYSGTINIRINGIEVSEYSAFSKIAKINSAEIIVDEGTVFAFGNTTISPLPDGAVLAEEFARGETARSTTIVDASTDAITAWRQNGRPKAKITQNTIAADHAAHRLDVVLKIETGGIATFGTLRVTGNTRMRENRVRKIAGLPKGETFSQDQLDKAANRLRATGIFNSVNLIEADAISSDGSIEITANVAEAKPRRFTFGASLSTDDGAAIEASWLHRNLLGGGEQLRFDAGITGIDGETDGTDYEFGVTLARPATLTPDTRARLELFYGRYTEPSYTLDELTAGLTFEHRFSDQLTASAGLAYSDIDTVDVFGQRNFRLITLPLTLAYDTRDDKLSPSQGYFLSVGAAPFTDLKGSDDGARLEFDGRAYLGFGVDKKFVLAGRVQLGSLVGPDLADAPPELLFYSGGGGTVRGQDYQSLGVTLPSGDTVGGKSFVGLSAELRAPIKGIFGGVLFADYGYIGENATLGQSGQSHSGIGAGLRIETGIGPVRVDVATPLKGGSNDNSVNFYIGIGQAF